MAYMDGIQFDDATERNMRALGYVVRQMGMLEVQLSRELASMMRGPDDIVLRVVAGENFKWQLDKLRALALDRPEDEQRAAFLATVRRAYKVYDRRNAIIHAAYDTRADDANGPAHRLRWTRGTTDLATGESLTPDEIWAFGDEIRKLSSELLDHTPFIMGWGPDPARWPGNTSGSA